ncbi:MAG: SCO family protein, partial [Casimicrobiaceae bacterium]
RVLFVTVDPGRDTLSRLHTYVQGFGPEFGGLRGTAGELAALAKRYRVTYALDPPDAKGDYEVRHSNAVFVFDTAGKARLLIRPQDSAAAITADLDRLAAESS